MNRNGLKEYRIGWIGLGRMGYPMAERLARAGVEVGGYNRTRARAAPLAEAGVDLVDRPADLAGYDIVFTMVSTARDLMEVTTGEGGLLARDDAAPAVLVDCSTVSAEDSAALRAAAAARGTRLLVAAVSGNDVVARAGKLGVLASGPRDIYETVRPYLACFGPNVSYVGEDDAARTVKICHNMLLAIVYQSMAEIAVLGETAGVPRHVTLEAINRSVLGSTFTRYKTPAIVNLDFTVTFPLSLLLKDLDLACDLAKRTGAALPMTSVAHGLTQRLIARAGDGVDYTELLRQQAADSGLDLMSENVEVEDGLS
jgi:3-hydroxyisobutyrate dehydrogenase